MRQGGGGMQDRQLDEEESEREVSGSEGNKRKERSPTMQETGRSTRRRPNEFELGEVFRGIEEEVSRRAAEVMATAHLEFRGAFEAGLNAVIGAMRGAMNGVSDAVTQQRLATETLELRMEDKLAKIEEKLKEVADATDDLTDMRIKNREKESIREMEAKLEESECALKVLNIDIGKVTSDKREIVRRTLDTARAYMREEDKTWFDTVIRRTRVVILGRETRIWEREGVTEYSVPTLFQCRDRRDTESLDSMLRGAGYFPAFHWPTEIVNFIWCVKDEVRKMGVDDRTHYFKVRPEKREGSYQIKVEVKHKEGGRFLLKGVWACPPLHKFLWDGVPTLLQNKIGGRG